MWVCMLIDGVKMEKLVCFIVARNLGDAVIQSAFLRKLASTGYAEGYIAWVRPQVAFLFKDIQNCQIVCSQFPVGTTKDFGLKNFWKFLNAAWFIRRLRPSMSMDLIGDFRERFFANLLGTPRHLYISWASGHPFNDIIRNPFGRGRPEFEIPANCPNIYHAFGLMLAFLSKGKSASILSDTKSCNSKLMKIGMHPFASQQCRLWPDDNWLAVATTLLEAGHELTLFGAAAERSDLERIFAPLLPRVSIFTRSLAEFTDKVAELDLFVGLDSFGVHMAQRQGVNTILINAGSNPAVWPPPSSNLLAKSGDCKYYPCNNVSKCEGTEYEFACIRSITPDDVLRTINVST